MQLWQDIIIRINENDINGKKFRFYLWNFFFDFTSNSYPKLIGVRTFTGITLEIHNDSTLKSSKVLN